MAFVDQHEVVSFKRAGCNGFVAHLIAELGDLDHIDPALEQRTGLVLVEDMGVDAGLAELLQMLARQALVRSQKDDPVREQMCIPRLEVVQVLQDVHMQ
ncbi:hypothetical protein D3C87_1506320 [compost metagenome]